ncbi:hypothetical protein OK016_02430 [Vibrio chagasii]|nr:hypothetical protein [Vibrio chagasii]
MKRLLLAINWLVEPAASASCLTHWSFWCWCGTGIAICAFNASSRTRYERYTHHFKTPSAPV